MQEAGCPGPSLCGGLQQTGRDLQCSKKGKILPGVGKTSGGGGGGLGSAVEMVTLAPYTKELRNTVVSISQDCMSG